jgi:sigma-B regulation protein RsbU (phosphoserine phosphatase)
MRLSKTSEAIGCAYPRIIFELERAQSEALKISDKHREYDYFVSLLASMQDLATAGYNTEECGQLRFSGSVIPAMGVSGDFYDFHYHKPSGNSVFWIGDVGGKGVNAGIVMASIQSIIRTILITNSDTELSLEDMLKVLNEVIYNNFTDKIEHTSNSATISLLAYKNGTLMFTGQHENVILIRSDEPVPVVIGTTKFSPIVGLSTDNFKDVYCGAINFRIGDKIVLYSDGVVEELTGSRSILGFDSFMRIIMTHKHLAPKEMKEQILLSLMEKAGHKKFYDDVTLLIVEPTH